MRVVNDRQPPSEPASQGFLAIALFASLSAVSIASLVLVPLPMILAHARLQDPWAKITAVLGAVVALTFLEVPLPVVLFAFVLGLFVADRVASGGGFWSALRSTTLLASALGFAALAILAQTKKLSLEAAWVTQVDAVLAQLKGSVASGDVRWEALRGVFLYEGPFLYLSGIIVSFWFSVGLAAHLDWLPAAHRFSAQSLREIRLPAWFTPLFVSLFVAGIFTQGQVQRLASGSFRVLGCLLFIQGCVTLSLGMQRRGLTRRVRTAVYAFSILIGFYALVGLGAVSPWWLKKQESLEEVT